MPDSIARVAELGGDLTLFYELEPELGRGLSSVHVSIDHSSRAIVRRRLLLARAPGKWSPFGSHVVDDSQDTDYSK